MRADLVRELRLGGVDLLTALDADMVDRADDEHLRKAADAGRVLYSFNIRDYARIPARWIAPGIDHAGIILTPRTKHSVGAQIARLLHIAASIAPAAMKNRLEFF
jgi:hypothetical protein